MSAQSFYGSSEYSPQAEELFALYVARLESGEAPDFEAYCEQHAEFADELIGLHTDWDNVRGLLSKLKDLGGSQGAQRASPIASPGSEVALPAEPVPAAPGRELSKASQLEAPAAQRSRPAARGRSVLCVLLGGTALALLLWNRDLRRGSEVLAVERNQLAARQAQAEQQLEETEAQRQSLQQESESLNVSLEQAHSEQEQLQAAHRQLSQRESKLRGVHDQLDQEHQRLNQAYHELDQSLADLSLEHAQARLAAAQAEQASVQNQERLEALAQLTGVSALRQRELESWPSRLESLGPLSAWLQEARRLAQRSELLGQTLGPLAQESEAVRELLAELRAWQGPGGLLERSELRLERLRRIAGDSEGSYADAWTEQRGSTQGSEERPAPLGLDLEPQFGLVPLGVDARTGLWTLEDRVTAVDSEGADELGASALPRAPGGELDPPGAPASRGLVYWLIRCGPASDAAAGAFLLATQVPEAHHYAAAGLELRGSQLAESSSLARLGLSYPSLEQLECLRASGLERELWLGRPVRRLVLQAD